MTKNPPTMKRFNLHLVSDATGDTLETIAYSAKAQFPHAEAVEYLWPMVRSKGMVEKVLEAIEQKPGIVLFTLVNPEIRGALEAGCRHLEVPHVPVLDPVTRAFEDYLGEHINTRPGLQHEMDEDYFKRVEAVNFCLAHDDGALPNDFNEADIIILGVSRTSKTPTSVYLAYRGLKTANIPIVPGVELPVGLCESTKPLIVGLTLNPKVLVEIRSNRLKMLRETNRTDYDNYEAVKNEVTAARRMYAKYGWPVIDVTRKSVEETAAAIRTLYLKRKEGIGL